MPTVSTQELDTYKHETSAAVEAATALEVKDFEGVMDAADFLFDVKGAAERVTERKEEITRPMNEALKSARSLFKPIEEACAKAEQIAKEKLLAWHYGEWEARRPTDNKIHGTRGNVTIVERQTVEITDEAAIPRGLCSPDPKKIEHYLLTGKKLKAAKLVPTYTIAAGRN